MRKLYKKNFIGVDTIEAYTCYCSCSCSCGCSCTIDTTITDKSNDNLGDTDSERYESKTYVLAQ